MKKSKIKSNFLFKLFSFLLISLFISSCSSGNETPLPDCGCESKTLATIPESSDLVGELFYKTQTNNPMDTYYNDKYWIVYQQPNCSNCISSMIVCNEDFIENILWDLKNENYSVEVQFSGHLKEICEKTFAPGDYTYQRITLTKIQKK